MKYLFLCILVPSLCLAALSLQATDDKQPPAEKAIKKPAAGRTLPFHGTVKAVDLKAGTITVGQRVFHVGKATTILKDDQPMELSEDLVGQRIGGSYVATEEGRLEARTIRVAKPKGIGHAPRAS